MATIGVKVELEGAKAFASGMKNMQAQSKLFDTQIKNLQKSMSKSPFQKSIQEGELLKKKLSVLEDESSALVSRIDELSKAYGENDTRVIQLKQKYEVLQGQIERTKSAISENGGFAGALSSQLDAIGQKIEGLGGKISTLGDNLSKNVTAPIVALGGASMVAFKEVDSGLDTIVTKTGATGESLEEMQNIAKNIATTIPSSFDEVGNSVGEVNTRFGATGSELEDLSTKFIQFAQLNNSDVSSSIDSVQSTMAAFGIESAKAGEVLDILNKAGQDTGISMETLSNSLMQNSASLTEMGMDFNTAAGFIANLEKNGVDTTSAMSGLKKAFVNATKDGKTMDDALAELQDTFKNAQSDTEAYQKAIDLFGAKAGGQLAKAIQEGRLSLDESANSVKNFGGSVSDTFNNTLDPIDSFTTNMNKIKLVGNDLVNSAAPLITSAMEKMAQAIQKVSDFWNGLSESQQQMILKIALLVAAIGPVLSIIGRLTSGIGSIISFVSTLIPLMATIGGVLTATVIPAIAGVMATLLPILPIIAAVGAAIAGVILIVQNWGSILDWLKEKWSVISQAVSTAVQGIATAISEKLTAIKTTWSTIWTNISTIVSTIFTGIKTKISTAVGGIKTTITNAINGVKKSFINIKDSALTWGKDMIQNFIDGILAKWESLKETVSNVAQSVKDFLGFTEPKKGALSNFHVFGRHMMENYANSIDGAKYLVKDAVSGVAVDVASALNQPLSADDLYSAVARGMESANTPIILNDRELTRALAGMGVVFNG